MCSKKVVFVHDHIFRKLESCDVYSSASFSYENLEPYRTLGSLVVIGRGVEIQSTPDNLARSSGPSVRHVLVDNVNSFRGLRHFRRIVASIKEAISGADLVVLRMPSSLSLITYWLAKRAGLPVFIEVVGNAEEALRQHGKISARALASVTHKLTSYCVKHASHVSYITSNYLQKIYPKGSEGKSYVSSNAMLTIVPKSCVHERVAEIQRIHESRGVIKIGLIGSLDVNYKGHLTALRALAYLNSISSIEFELNFVGGGSAQRWQEVSSSLGVSENVNFIGSLRSGAGVWKFIDSMQFTWQPSSVEAQGRSIIEAMSRACPTITTNVGGIVELFDNSLMIDDKDFKSLAERTLELIVSPDKLNAFINEQYDQVQRFDREEIINQKVSDMMECINDSRLPTS